MIYRGPGFLAVVRLGSCPPPPTASSTHRKTEKERQLADGGGGGDWGGAKSYDGEKAWSSINNSIISIYLPTRRNVKYDTGLKIFFSPAFNKFPKKLVVLFVF
jgi:hypothetical protein